jgi:primosomal protein N''
VSKIIVAGALLALLCVSTVAQKRLKSQLTSESKTHVDDAAVRAQPPYQHRETWYEFMLKQFNPENVDYGRWLEERRQEFIEGRIKNPYFGCTVFLSLALFVMSAVCVKQWIDHRRCLSITAEMMADIYRQDSYSRQVAHEAIERYNKHIEHCNRTIEAGENALTPAANNEVDQLRTELMRVAEERDCVIRERDIAREDSRKRAEILADMSVRLESLTTKLGGANQAKTSADLREADSKLIAHINNLQEQLYTERNHNRRLRGG